MIPDMPKGAYPDPDPEVAKALPSRTGVWLVLIALAAAAGLMVGYSGASSATPAATSTTMYMLVVPRAPGEVSFVLYCTKPAADRARHGNVFNGYILPVRVEVDPDGKIVGMGPSKGPQKDPFYPSRCNKS